MDRKTEYIDIINIETPLELDGTVKRAKDRARKGRRKAAALCAGGIAAVVLAFTIMVNTSAGFAYAMGRIPLLSDIAKTLCMSSGQKAAVEHEYAQVINKVQKTDGVTMAIDYVVVDRKQVNIFYRLNHPGYEHLVADVVQREDGRLDNSWAAEPAVYYWDKGFLCTQLNYFDEDVPNSLELTFNVHPASDENMPRGYVAIDSKDDPEKDVAQISFTLDIDPSYTGKSEVQAVNEWYDAGGHRIYIESIEQYPSQLRLRFKAEEERLDSAYMIGHAEIDGEVKYGNSSFSCISHGNGEYTALMYIDQYFQKGDKTLVIESLSYHYSDGIEAKVNLKSGRHDALPDGVNIWIENIGGKARMTVDMDDKTLVAIRSVDENALDYTQINHRWVEEDLPDGVEHRLAYTFDEDFDRDEVMLYVYANIEHEEVKLDEPIKIRLDSK